MSDITRRGLLLDSITSDCSEQDATARATVRYVTPRLDQGAVEPSAFITSDQKRALYPAPKPGGFGPDPATKSVPEVK